MYLYGNLAGVIDPQLSYDSNVNCASVEFSAIASDEMCEDYASRTPLFEESKYKDFAELLESDDYLTVYITVYEDGFVDATITLTAENKDFTYVVTLSDEEQKELYTFISDYCDSHIGESLTAMFGSAAMDAAEYQRDAAKDTSVAKYFDER